MGAGLDRKKLRVATCQFPVGSDLRRNLRAILRQMRSAKERGAHVAHFCEGALTGYAGVDTQEKLYDSTIHTRALAMRGVLHSGTLVRDRRSSSRRSWSRSLPANPVSLVAWVLGAGRLATVRRRRTVVSDATMSGSCLCGEVRFSVTPPSLFCGHCHCTLCQRSHGAGYVTWFAVPSARFALEAGSETLVVYRSSLHGRRSFCGKCGSSLFCEYTNKPDQVDIVLANMHGPIDLAPQVHIFFDDRAEWVVVEDGLPRLGGETGLEPVKGDA